MAIVSDTSRIMLSRAASILLALWLLFSFSARTRAQDTADSARARALFEQGVEAGKQGDLRSARELFAKSRDVVPAVSTLLNLAIVQKRLSEPLEALATLELLESMAQADRDGALMQKGDRLREELEAEVSTLQLELTPNTAALTIDGRASALNPKRRVHLMPGKHVLRAEAEGYAAAQLAVDLGQGKIQRLSLQLTELPATAADPAPVPLAESREGGSAHATAENPDFLNVPPESKPARLSKPWRLALWLGAVTTSVAAVTITSVVLLRDDSRPPAGDVRF